MADLTVFFVDLEDGLTEQFDRIMERCGDEHGEEPERAAAHPDVCGRCDYFLRCDIDGYEDVGWCRRFEWFYEGSHLWDECW